MRPRSVFALIVALVSVSVVYAHVSQSSKLQLEIVPNPINAPTLGVGSTWQDTEAAQLRNIGTLEATIIGAETTCRASVWLGGSLAISNGTSVPMTAFVLPAGKSVAINLLISYEISDDGAEGNHTCNLEVWYQ